MRKTKAYLKYRDGCNEQITTVRLVKKMINDGKPQHHTKNAIYSYKSFLKEEQPYILLTVKVRGKGEKRIIDERKSTYFVHYKRN